MGVREMKTPERSSQTMSLQERAVTRRPSGRKGRQESGPYLFMEDEVEA